MSINCGVIKVDEVNFDFSCTYLSYGLRAKIIN